MKTTINPEHLEALALETGLKATFIMRCYDGIATAATHEAVLQAAIALRLPEPPARVQKPKGAA